MQVLIMQHRKFFKTVSITLGLCGGAIIIPTLASCSVQQTRQPYLKESINAVLSSADSAAANAKNSKDLPLQESMRIMQDMLNEFASLNLFS